LTSKRFASKPYASQYRYVEKCRNQKASLALKGGGPPKVVEGYKRGISLIEKRIPQSASQTAPFRQGGL
jgi:hypothetical protein